MKAAIIREQGAAAEIIDTIEIDPPKLGQVKVKVSHCGICHSDLSIADGAFPSPVPVLLGHEATGIVEEIGPGVTSLSVGDPVVLTACPPCGTCYWCVRGESSICVNAIGIVTNALPDGSTGLSLDGEVVYRGVNLGAFGEYVVVPESGAIKIGDDVPLDVACVIGCAVQTGVGAVLNTAQVEEGATVLVQGLGGIGLSVVQGARLAGAAKIIVSDPLADRRAKAVDLGATHTLDPTTDDVQTAVMDLTSVGVDYAFEAAGRAALVQSCFHSARNGGTVVAVGAPPIEEKIEIDPAALFTISQKRLLGCVLGSVNSLKEIPRLIALWQAGRLNLESLVTGRRPLEQINDGFEDLRQGKGIRTVLDM